MPVAEAKMYEYCLEYKDGGKTDYLFNASGDIEALRIVAQIMGIEGKLTADSFAQKGGECLTREEDKSAFQIFPPEPE